MDREKLRRKANRHPDQVSLLPEELIELLDKIEAQERRIEELEAQHLIALIHLKNTKAPVSRDYLLDVFGQELAGG